MSQAQDALKKCARKAPANAPQPWQRILNNGFTLIELLVVVALISVIAFIALPKVTSVLKLSLNSASRNLASHLKEAYNAAVMTGKVYRVAYDLKEHSYWVESGPNTILLHTAETKEKEERRKRFASKSDQVKDESAEFRIEKTITRKKLSLPRGVEFEDVITEQNKEPQTAGTVYTHIFPHGITEQTVIHLKDTSDHHVTLVISPIAGRIQMHLRYMKEDELYGGL